MSYLLDTHILLWWLMDEPKLSKQVRNIIASEAIWVSTAVIWEMVIKNRLGKLVIPHNLKEVLQTQDFDILDIRIDHVLGLHNLEDRHSDPFDRIQIAQAKTEGLTFITKDRRILEYEGIQFIEA